MINTFQDGVVGSAAQFIAAVLETAGLYGQSQILENFQPIFRSVGSLIYLWCAIGALISVAIFGNYRQGMYFFFGPALFWFILTWTVPVTGTRHQVGLREDNTIEEQLGFLKKAGDPNRYEENGTDGNRRQKEARVSGFFVVYDDLVSSIVRQLVSFLLNEETREDLMFAARERVMTRVLGERVTESQFHALLSKGMMGQCSKALGLAKEISAQRLQQAEDGTPEATERAIKKARYQSILTERIHLDDSLKHYIQSLGQTVPEEAKCPDIWKVMKVASLKAAEEYLKPTPDELSRETPEYWEKVYNEVKKKLIPDQQEAADTPEALDARAAEVLAAFMLKNSLVKTAHSGFTVHLGDRQQWDDYMSKKVYGNDASNDAQASRQKIVYFAGAVTYVQGLLLYLLTCAFPFFVPFLLMPSRVSAFFVWMSLWLWVKSWDVGFAIIHFLRDLFWETMPHAGDVRTAGNFRSDYRELDWTDPASIFNVVYANDPTAHLNTYYTIIAILTFAVPVLSAHLCMGATNLYDSLKLNLDGMADRFGNEKANSARRSEGTLAFNEFDTEQRLVQQWMAATEAGRSPGKTDAGLSREATGDGTIGRHMNSAAAMKWFNYHFSDEHLQRANFVSSLTGRRMSYSARAAVGYVNALTNRDREQFETRPAGTGGYNPLFASDLAKNNNTKIGDTAPENQRDSDGDGG